MKPVKLLPVAALVGAALFVALTGSGASACGGQPCPTPTTVKTYPTKTSTPHTYPTKTVVPTKTVTPRPTRPPRTATPVATLTPPPTSTPLPPCGVPGRPLCLLTQPGPVAPPTNWVITQTCAGTIQTETYSGFVRRLDNTPAPWCQVYAPSQVKPYVVPAPQAPCCTSQSGSFTTTTQVSGVRIAPPSTGDGGLK